jgi:hypothetical protein
LLSFSSSQVLMASGAGTGNAKLGRPSGDPLSDFTFTMINGNAFDNLVFQLQDLQKGCPGQGVRCKYDRNASHTKSGYNRWNSWKSGDF